jgi:thiamine-phosphate pyrophosphorylase
MAVNGLYAITPDCRSSHEFPALLEGVKAALAGGARVLQYRNKQQPNPDCIPALLQVCRAAGATLIINDDVQLATMADGVHLGCDDMDIAEARKVLGPDKVIGVSCYNDLERAIQAEAAGADYVAFGSMFVSPTKPDAPRASLDLIRDAKKHLRIPVVAIGGITLQNAALLVEAGADAIAVINAVFSASDITQTARNFSELFTGKS